MHSSVTFALAALLLHTIQTFANPVLLTSPEKVNVKRGDLTNAFLGSMVGLVLGKKLREEKQRPRRENFDAQDFDAQDFGPQDFHAYAGGYYPSLPFQFGQPSSESEQSPQPFSPIKVLVNSNNQLTLITPSGAQIPLLPIEQGQLPAGQTPTLEQGQTTVEQGQVPTGQMPTLEQGQTTVGQGQVPTGQAPIVEQGQPPMPQGQLPIEESQLPAQQGQLPVEQSQSQSQSPVQQGQVEMGQGQVGTGQVQTVSATQSHA